VIVGVGMTVAMANRFEEISPRETLSLIESSNPNGGAELARLIAYALGCAVDAAPSCALATYNLLEPVSRQGQPFLPGNAPFPSDHPYLQDNGLPFGVVVEHTLSLELPVAVGESSSHELVAFLKPGTPFGLLELLHHTHHDFYGFPIQPWNVTAGSTKIYPISDVISKRFCYALQGVYGETIDENNYVKCSSLTQALHLSQTWRREVSGWRAKIVFLSREFVDALGILKPLSALENHQLPLALFLSRLATGRLVNRYFYFDRLWYMFKADRAGASLKPRKQAFDFWRGVLGGAYGKYPIYQLTSCDDSVFPIRKTCEFLGHCERHAMDLPSKKASAIGREAEQVLFAPSCQALPYGYLPISRILEFEQPKAIKDVVVDVAQFYNSDIDDRTRLVIDEKLFFSSLAFGLSIGQKDRFEFMRFDPTASGARAWVSMDKEQFFSAPTRLASTSGNGASDAERSYKLKKPLNALVRIDVDALTRRGEGD